MSKLTLVLGGPGCGKTTRLLEIVEREMRAGVAPGEIAFVAFTRAAATEAQQRAAKQFSLDPKRDLPYFRTLHSLSYQLLGMTRDEIMARRDWYAFAKMIGEPLTGTLNEDRDEEFSAQQARGDRMLYVHDFARNTGRSLKETWAELEPELDYHALERFVVGLGKWKAYHTKVDYTDMIVQAGNQCPPLRNIRVAVIDEAQDLTRAQWTLVDQLFREADRLYVGGDDDQAIYKWTGADVERFLSLKGKRDVLPISYRLSPTVWSLAQTIASRIKKRFPKEYQPMNKPGSVSHWSASDLVPISDHPGSWLVLARNGYMLRQLEPYIRSIGHLYTTRWGSSAKPEHVEAIYGWEAWRKGKAVSAETVKTIIKHLGISVPVQRLNAAQQYTAEDILKKRPTAIWHEILSGIPMEARVYYVSCLRRGERLKETPRIRLETIHGVKGGEADNVMLLTDMSARTHAAYEKDPDNEHRVFYVAVTRTKENLHVVEPQTANHYAI